MENNTDILISDAVAALGEGVELISYERINKGLNTLYRLNLNQYSERIVVLKIYTFNNGTRYAQKESHLYQYLSENTSIPVPGILAAGIPQTSSPPWLVMTAIPGNEFNKIELPSEGILPSIMRQAGKYLGELHQKVTFESYGRLEFSGDSFQSDGCYQSWEEELESFIEMGTKGITNKKFNHYPERVRTTMAELSPILESNPNPVLMHQDYRLGNMIFEQKQDGGQITGILDWERSIPGHSEYDLSSSEYLLIDRLYSDSHLCEVLREEFFGGYCEKKQIPDSSASDKRFSLYRAVNILLLMRAFEDIWGTYDKSRQNEAANRLSRDMEATLSSLP
ncbi:phosphotransferase family protein [Haloplanus pelagicus]|uniref:phosphotransferase family protein n=1 Tax=Haloplanus pelagicus TaxID=2949995 RepID=UPI002041501E|nr:aminoglycoside phosphotransferase family protein [Haloplanus sp. HW8-1]